jgi:putative FmdB family regulatory protein
MAAYDYKCSVCDVVFTITGPYSTLFNCKPICPCCKSNDVKKIYSNISVIYKGKGFYNTDNNKNEKSE